MKSSHILIFPIVALSLMGCNSGNSSSDSDVLEQSPPGTVISTRNEYIPEHGATTISENVSKVTLPNREAVIDNYTAVTSYSYIDELPDGFNYKHPGDGPFMQTKLYHRRTGEADKHLNTSYYIRSENATQLIDHEVGEIGDTDDDYYSTIEFNSIDEESSNDDNLSFAVGENITSKVRKKFFNKSSGNEVGTSFLQVKVKIIGKENITLNAGKVEAVRASYDTNYSKNTYGRSSKSFSQALNGTIWFEASTGNAVKFETAGTFQRKDRPDLLVKAEVKMETTRSINPLSKLYQKPNKSLAQSASPANIQTAVRDINTEFLKSIKLANPQF